MSLNYIKIKKSPIIFNRLFGVSVSQFEEILLKIEPQWQKQVINRYKRPGRDYKLELGDMLLLLLLYYRSYITQMFIGYLFGIDDSRVCRIIQRLEPILAGELALTKTKHLSQEEVETLIIDATEQPIERPSRNQKRYYSGKKKRHTIKTEIRITRKGRIVHVSRSRRGAMHDFALHKEEPPIPPDSRAFVDSGYQGLDKRHQATELPYKATKTKPLDKEEKEYNHALSRYRVIVENIIGDIKTFKILSDRYRNKRKRYGIKFHIISGIVNLKNGFATT
jgi:DDE superfamily endonuclease/Helix-turn-helix of DDE superfamily endonuclease